MASGTRPVTAVIVGAGGRGMTYAQFALAHPDRLQIVGAAEPRDWNRQQMADTYDLAQGAVFSDWRDLAARPRFADAAIIATQDAMHLEPAVALAKLGYAILLEKPMAPNEADCQRIVAAAKENGNLFAVCHVMRYTGYTQALKTFLDTGIIGEIISVEHLEPVGYWHQAHSFVRGNWRNSQESSFMLLAKSCHDLDWIRYIVGEPCLSLSSFGALSHFKKSQKPAAAGDAARCLHCAYELDCPYSAKKIYLGRLDQGQFGWPVNVLTPEPTVETVTAALENGPYGRCVYECDNDVVDHQVVNMRFANEKTAVFTMTAFNKANNRKTRIFGTRGEIYGDGEKIEHFDFLTDRTQVIDTNASDGSILGGHGGGDYGLMDHFVSAVAQNNPNLILSGADESLETHRMVFAAERARLENKVVDL
ncbi:MAG: Gfo/Idh/MocA family oxidoreductase [Anaerolineaceae bacterium]|nr:Gfo/Idh/MocA family oxidoreductase [Anaerolineaceae bacterium]